MAVQNRNGDEEVRRVVLLPNKRLMEVVWNDTSSDHYPYIWLRDNCQCSDCFETKSQTRAHHFNDLDLNARPTRAEVRSVTVFVIWEDEHTSGYDARWLRERSFNSEARQLRDRLHSRPVITWNAQQMANPPKAKFDDILTDDRALYDWIAALEEVGLVILTDAPQVLGTIKRLGERVAYLRKCHYGETFVVQTKSNASNIAYTAGRLTLHCDLQYINNVPGMQMLHCISQTTCEGGENELVDGFHVAQLLRNTDPEAFKLLSEVELDFYDIGKEKERAFHTLSRHTTIELDLHKRVKQIHFSTHGRDSSMPVTLDQVEPLYRALHKFCRMCYDPANMITYKMKDGDILCFDNQRVLHGRKSFQMAASTVRVLEGSYIDWDELHCARRVLKDTLGVAINHY